MFRSLKLICLASSLLLLGASGSALAQSSPNTKTAVSSTDSTFMKHAAAGNMAEIDMGRMALNKSSDAQVKQLAQRIVDDHTAANAKLKTLAESKHVTLPAGPTPDARKAAASMRKMDGSAFDKAWSKHMVTDHQKAIKMFTKASSNSKDPDVRNFAQATLPVLKTHLEMAQKLVAAEAGTH